MLYFSYGSNMSFKRIVERVPSAKVVQVAKLERYELKFHKVSTNDGSAKCDIQKTNKPDQIVLGVVYDIDAVEKPILDSKEGLGDGYEQRSIKVITDEGEELEAFAYCATVKDEKLKPYHWYKEHVLRGARENSLPEYYIRGIEGIQSIADPDPCRHEKEMAIYR